MLTVKIEDQLKNEQPIEAGLPRLNALITRRTRR